MKKITFYWGAQHKIVIQVTGFDFADFSIKTLQIRRAPYSPVIFEFSTAKTDQFELIESAPGTFQATILGTMSDSIPSDGGTYYAQFAVYNNSNDHTPFEPFQIVVLPAYNRQLTRVTTGDTASANVSTILIAYTWPSAQTVTIVSAILNQIAIEASNTAVAASAEAESFRNEAEGFSEAAFDSATSAAGSAVDATNKAGEALSSANTATTQAGIAIDQAEISIAKAGEAGISANNAASSEATTENYRNEVIAAYNNLTTQGNFKGAWNASTNSPTLSPIPSAANDYYEVTVAGTQSVTGASVAFIVGDRVRSNGTAWVRVPFAIADGTLSPEKFNTFLNNLVQQLPDESPYLYLIQDALRRNALAIRKADGFIEGRFVIEAISMMANAVHTASIQPAAVTLPKLAQEVKDSFPASFDATYSDYLYLILDAMNRIAFGIKKDGTVEGKFAITAANILANAIATANIQNEAVTLAKLATEVKSGFSTVFDATYTDWLYLLLDSMNRIGLGIKKDGTLVAKVALANGSVTETMLSSAVLAKLPSSAFNRLNTPNLYDVDIEDDGLWRGVEIEIPCKTELTGYGFAQFPPVKTKILRGLNNTGTSLQFAKTSGISLRGKRYRGTFDPTSSGIVGTNLVGRYGNSVSNSYPAFPAGSTGDCWVIDCGNTTATVTANGLTFKTGDMLVKTAGGYAIQPGPGDGTFREGDFWNVTTSGTFGGAALLSTGRIIMLGYESASGPKYVKYIASKTGEFYLMGECDPSTFTPSSPRNGDLFVFSAGGTTQGVTGATGDNLIYDGGWGLVQSGLVTIANGLAFALPCENARDWSVRRTDKSTTSVTINAKGQGASLRRRPSDELLLLSDSMFGVNAVGNNILSLSGRTGTVLSYGGGTSNDVLAMLRSHLRGSDPYKGRVCVFWHGQNNSTDTAQIKMAAYEMASLVGSVQKRFAFWSVLGTRGATFNGTRIVIAQHEDAKAGTNFIAQTEQFYQAAFPNQFFCTRQALLDSAVGRTTPDLQFPGMTEAQVASTYGIVPLSYFFNYSSVSWTPSQLNFLGYHSASGLPSGGNDLDYYVRTGGGTVGLIIVKVSGTWTENTHDTVHLTAAGSLAVATKFNEYLTLKNI